MDDTLERILEEGMAGYAAAEPLAGLEARILGRIRLAERPPRHWKGSRVAFAVGLAGVTLGAAALMLMPMRHEVPRPVSLVTAVPSRAPLRRAVTALPVSATRRHHASHTSALPKLVVFPTPSPLTREERRLMAMVENDPEGTLAAFESLRAQSAPIAIAPLVIEPLDSSTGQ